MVLLLKHRGPSIKIRAAPEECKPFYLSKDAFSKVCFVKTEPRFVSRECLMKQTAEYERTRLRWRPSPRRLGEAFLLVFCCILSGQMKDYAAGKVEVCVVCEGSAHERNTADTISMSRSCRRVLSFVLFFQSPANPGFDEDLKIPQISASVFKNKPAFVRLGLTAGGAFVSVSVSPAADSTRQVAV